MISGDDERPYVVVVQQKTDLFEHVGLFVRVVRLVLKNVPGDDEQRILNPMRKYVVDQRLECIFEVIEASLDDVYVRYVENIS
jgi:hypothetical protein